ncbi:unannotated protein [freshwater metagenome]|uniref:Unannotated protein n=1 Tax=freshwater metagenome TaxID=449393 RepID=A0A6J6HZS9_9ZZZZ
MLVDEHLFFKSGEPADAGADPDTLAGGIAADIAGHCQCFVGGSQRELSEAVGSTRFFRVCEIRFGIKVLDTTQPFGRGRQQSVPERFGANAARADDTDACNRYPTFHAHRFDITSS